MNSPGGGTSAIVSSFKTSPLATPQYDDGTWNDFVTQPAGGLNPVAYLYEVSNKWRSNRIVANAGITIRPVSGLSIQLTGNLRDGLSRKDYFKTNKYPNAVGETSISF